MLELLNKAFVRLQSGHFGREEGQAVAEYALILGVIAVGVVLVLGTLKTNIVSKLTNVATSIGP